MTIMNDPYQNYRTSEKPTDDAFVLLDQLLDNLENAEDEVKQAELNLKKAQEKVRTISEHDIPEYMDTLGLEDFTTKSGKRVRVISKIRASIGSRKAAAFKWLIDHGHGGLIKRTIAVAFNRDQQQDAEALLEDLQGRFAGAKQDMKVEAATLTAFVKEQLEQGVPIPHDTFGIMEQKLTKVEYKK